MMAIPSKSLAMLALVLGAGLAAVPAAHAQVATTLEQAELAGLNAEKRAEVEARMKQGGQTVSGILETILLNSLKLKYPASRIVALDFGRGLAVLETTDNKLEKVSFDTTTLAIKP
jgi:hypothetical protein